MGNVTFRPVLLDEDPDDVAHNLGHRAVVGSDPFRHISLMRATVVEEVALPLEHRGMARQAMWRRCEEVLDSLGLAELADRRPERLSGGETRRLALAIVSAARPRTVVTVDPFGGLDEANARCVSRFFDEYDGKIVVVGAEEGPVEKLPERVVPGDVRHFHGIALRRGGVVWLSGPNGAGKTTQMRRWVGPGVSLALQRPAAQVVHSSVAAMLGAGDDERHPLDLSSARLRLVQVEAVCGQGRDIVLLDEPDTGLGPDGREKLHRIIASTLQRGAAMVVTSHNEGFIGELRGYAYVEKRDL